MISRVHSPALPGLHPAVRLAGPAQPPGGVQGHRVAGAAARGRRAAPHPVAATAGLGGPRGARCADPPPAQTAADAPPGDTRHRAPVASPPGRAQVDLSAPDGPACGQRRDHRAHRAARHREPHPGVPADPGRAPQARPPGQRLHDPPGPQDTDDPPGTEAAHRYDLAAVPASSGRDHARHRFLPRRLRSKPPPPVLPVRHGSRLPLRACPWRDRESGRPAGHPADPQPPDGSR